MSKYLRLQDCVLPLQHPCVLIETAVEQGAPLKRLLQDTGISVETLRDPDARISYLSFGQLAMNALQLTDNPALGIDFGRRIRFTNHGMTGLAMCAAATAGDAVRTQLRFGAIFAPAWDCSLRVTGARAIISALPVLPFGELRAFGAESLIGALIQMALQPGTLLHELRFNYAAPAHAARYAEMAPGVAIRFDQPTVELELDAAALEAPQPTADLLTYELAVRECEATLRRLPGRTRLVNTVRTMIDEGDGQYRSHEAVAETLGMSARALRRALKELGTSYQTLLDERRRENAVHYLRDTTIPLETAARQLGFSDVRSLRRSVRRWTGMSLQELRAQTRRAVSLH